jgi:hypothetical protein
MAFSGVSRECDVDTIAVWTRAPDEGIRRRRGELSGAADEPARAPPASFREHILKRSLRTRIST